MKTNSDRIWLCLAACLCVSGCISSTTGPARPDADEGDAAELNYQLGARYYRNGNYELARDRLLYSIELDPRSAVSHSTLALTYEQLGNLRLATESYEQAVKVEPRNFGVLNTYAVFLCRQARYDEAEKFFDRAVRVPENDNAEITLTNAGVCMAQKPDLGKAESFFRRALERKPNYGEALLQMSLMKHSQGDDLIARAFLQRFLSSNPPSASILYLGVQIETELGDDRARSEYENRILREYPESPEARRILESGQG
ncbi:MAG: type IV pilus biogenesis/stability protein PilW [Gammaproteobacteria bacterium]|nr:type IV pilus biogenesis/stability protein PilW [Gammaproteobacteria bacterium]